MGRRDDHVTKSAKTGLICTSNYTQLMGHNFPCDHDLSKLASFTVLYITHMYVYVRIQLMQAELHNNYLQSWTECADIIIRPVLQAQSHCIIIMIIM